MIDRLDRVKEKIKREVSVILQEDIDDPRVRHVTITRVELTRDLKIAWIYYIPDPEESDPQETARGLRSAGGFIRHELAARIDMKFTPKVSFREDKEEERKESIDKLFEKIEEESREKDIFLICYEGEDKPCHRKLLLQLAKEHFGAEVDLAPFSP